MTQAKTLLLCQRKILIIHFSQKNGTVLSNCAVNFIGKGLSHGDEEALFAERQAYVLYVEFGKRAKKKHKIKTLNIN